MAYNSLIMSNQKIIVDIVINSNSLREIPQYRAAFDTLKSSVDNVNKEIIRYNNQNKESITWGTKVKAAVKDLYETFDTFEKVSEAAEKAFEGWTGIASAAFTLITTYGPQVLDFLGEMFRSDKANQAAQALKDYKEVMESYVANISGEISQLGLLSDIANNENLSKQIRIDAIRQLNNLSPEYLNNLTLENLKTKEGKQLLDDYTGALNRKAMQEATQEQRVKYVKQRLELKPEYDKAKKDRNDYISGKKKDEKITISNTNSFGISTSYSYNAKSEAETKFAEQVKKDKKILQQIKSLDDALAESLLKYAPKHDPSSRKNRSYWETTLAVEQKNLDKLEAGAHDFEKKAKPIIAKIKRIKSTLKKYSSDEIQVHISSGNDRPKPKTPITRDHEVLEAKSEGLHALLSEDQKNYDKDLAKLTEQLNKKLITQQEYNEKSAGLQKTYHQGLESHLQQFVVKDMEATQQHLKNLADAEGLKKAIAMDEKEAQHAILPAQKLAAEKQLIMDKYEYEKTLAAGNSEKITELELQKQQALTTLAQQYEQQRKEFALNSAQQVADKAFSIIGNNIKSSSDAKIKGYEKDKANELSNKSLTQTQRKAIEDKYKKKENEEKVKAFKAEQKASVLQAVVNGALAVTKATSQTGILAPFVIPGIIAATAMQIATIVAQKPPAFAKGGQYISDGRGALLPGYSRTDNTNAYLRSGEAVVVSEAMRNPWARNLVSAINVAHGGRDFSMPNVSRGYAVGGIFTDGGNANRYYNQPVNDIKEMANTVAYQMINNFPPIYVDVKDVNNQQNILAQTVNRVNL